MKRNIFMDLWDEYRKKFISGEKKRKASAILLSSCRNNAKAMNIP